MKHHLQQEITNSCKFAIHRRHEAPASATHAHAHGTPSSPKRNRNSTLRPFLRRTRRPDRSTVVRFLRKRSVQLKRSATLKGPLVRRPFDTRHVLQKTPQSPATRTLRPCEAPVTTPRTGPQHPHVMVLFARKPARRSRPGSCRWNPPAQSSRAMPRASAGRACRRAQAAGAGLF